MQTNSYIPIILCGGDINYSHLPMGAHRSNAMIPINGKPVIGWIFEDLQKKGFRETIVVLQFENHKLANYLKWTFSNLIDLHFAYVQPGGTILHSLLAGLSWVLPGKSVYVVLGDTLIEDPLPPVDDFVFAGPYDEPENWCLVKTDDDGNVLKFYDKEPVTMSGLTAAIGGYAFSRTDILRNCVVRQIQAQKRELSAALSLYNDVISLKIIPARYWYDFGHIEGFNRAKRTLLQSRYFNSLSIDPVRGIITKRSKKTDKLDDELNWYHQLPDSLKVFTPRIFSNNIEKGETNIVQEFYGYPNLAELFVFGDLNLVLWKNALRQLFEVHKQFLRFPNTLQPADLEAMYRKKTFDRLQSLENDAAWQRLLQQERIVINGQTVPNLPQLYDHLQQAIKSLLTNNNGAIIHGDYCFSNILYDLQTQIIRLVDPRGSFGQKGIYGDPRYDIAKLRHSVSGLYDFILADMFKIEREPERYTFHFEVFRNENQKALAAYLDQLIVEMGYQLHEIILIEGLLFLSMVPYHDGKPERQLAMYLTGILILNRLTDYFFLNENSFIQTIERHDEVTKLMNNENCN